MKLKLIYCLSVLLSISANHAMTKPVKTVDVQTQLANYIANLETDSLIAYFAHNEVSEEIKRKALLMVQKQLVEINKIADKNQSLLKSKPDALSALKGIITASCGIAIMSGAQWLYNGRAAVISERIEYTITKRKDDAAALGDNYTEDIDRRNLPIKYESLAKSVRNLLWAYSATQIYSGITNLVNGLERTDAKEKLKKAYAIEFFLRNIQN